jgi:mRNA-degrading endonuclease toxin of MazEF toxin-antitoxin module
MSHDAFNRTPTWNSIIVVPLSTSVAQARRGPTAVSLPRGTAGLPRSGVALCHQVTTLDRSKLTRQIGAVSAPVMAEIEAGLKAALDLS